MLLNFSQMNSLFANVFNITACVCSCVRVCVCVCAQTVVTQLAKPESDAHVHEYILMLKTSFRMGTVKIMLLICVN